VIPADQADHVGTVGRIFPPSFSWIPLKIQRLVSFSLADVVM
jgi:hypothetical protein